MSDARLALAARHAKAHPADPEAQAALLRERLRAGTLSGERLELAAYCGHEGAQVACGRPLGEILCEAFPVGTQHRAEADEWGHTVMAQLSSKPLGTMPLGVWVAGLSRWGPEVLTRAAVAAALATWGELRRIPLRDGLLDEGREAARAMPAALSPEWARPVYAIVAAENWLSDRREQLAWVCHDAHKQLAWVWHDAHTAAGDPAWIPWPNDQPEGLVRRIAAAAILAGEEPVRQGIQAELVAWALS